ncbi:hypothetical protein [Streptomyces sp. NPDC059247]|uniref:hypothetical protein n=1 Tax=Streptomyces sp. NPDC059247 TaxID=3346790 RepID=UPI0036B43CBB
MAARSRRTGPYDGLPGVRASGAPPRSHVPAVVHGGQRAGPFAPRPRPAVHGRRVRPALESAKAPGSVQV